MAGRTDSTDAAADLVEMVESGALSDHPGPVILINADGGVVTSNIPAAPLAHRYRQGEHPSLTSMVAAVIGGAGTQTFKMSDPEIGGTIDLAAIPVVDGGVLLLGRDVSLDHNLRAALVDSRQRYKDLVEISSDFAWETDSKGTFAFVSTAGALGYDPDELVGHTADRFLVTTEGASVSSPFVSKDPVQGVEVRFRRAGGEIAILEAAAAPLFDDEGRWLGARGVCRDVTDARQRDAALAHARRQERLSAYIMRAIRDEIEPDRMLDTAAHAVIRALASDGCALYRIVPGAGLVVAAEVGRPLPNGILDAVHEAVTGRLEPAVAEFDVGAVLAHQLSYHQEMNGAVFLWRDGGEASWTEDEATLLTEVASQLGIALRQAAAHEHLRMLSSTDAMTGLMNRRAFLEALSDRLSQPETATGALTYVDLDNFKQVNDIRGHHEGDRALIHLADILRRNSGPQDLVARFGGDEFAAWLDGVDGDDAPVRAAAILEAGRELLPYSGSQDKPVGLSIGMAVHTAGDSEDRDELIARADAVMYEVKRSGKGSYRVAPPPSSSTPAPTGART